MAYNNDCCNDFSVFTGCDGYDVYVNQCKLFRCDPGPAGPQGLKGDDGSKGVCEHGELIDICHVPNGNSDAAHTITISLNAWENGHRPNHNGDYTGLCEEGDEDSSSDDK